MAKKRKGESVCLYLEETLNQFLSEKATELEVSKSEIVNNMIKQYKSLNDIEFHTAKTHLINMK